MNTPIRHHYIPRMILRNFTDNKGRLHCFYKPAGKIFSTTPDNVLAESHLYTRQDASGRSDVSVEKKLSHLEGRAQPVIEKIVHAARKRKKPALTSSEKEAWDEYFCSQLRRLPAARESLPDAELVAEHLDKFEEEIRPLQPAEREEFSVPKLQRKIIHNAWVPIIVARQGELLEVLQDKGLVIGFIENARKSVVTGDNPIIEIASQGRTSLHLPEVERLFPLAHDTIVTPGLPAGNEKLVVLDNTGYIRQINEEILNKSNVIVGRSHALIESLSRRHGSLTHRAPS